MSANPRMQEPGAAFAMPDGSSCESGQQILETRGWTAHSVDGALTLLDEQVGDLSRSELLDEKRAVIDGLKPYPKMKDSGVPWLGEVPEHWQIERLKSSVSNVIDQTGERQKGELYVALEHVESWTGRVRPAASDVTFESLVKRFRAGDILFGKLRPYLAKVACPTRAGVCVGEFLVLRPGQLDGPAQYLEQLLRSKPVIEAVNSSTFGAKMPRADWHYVGGLAITLPPVPEQAAIVRFLDHADRRIRRYIGAKQKLIKLLEEQKQAIIHRAVTRGLDPNVRLKPSGVEWLGDVPEHWEVARLGRLIELMTGFPFKSDGFSQDVEDVRLLRGVNVSPGSLRWTDVVRWPLSERDKYSGYELQVGDIVLGMDRPLVQRGTRVAMVTEPDVPALLLQRVARIRPRYKLQSDFLALLLAGKSFADYLAPIFTGISVPHLSPEQIKSFCFALPTYDEQREIVRWTAENTGMTNFTISNADREIQLLREYRTRLIADVVTGKLDVREAAARLPDETEEPEPVDEAAEADDEALTDDVAPEEVAA